MYKKLFIFFIVLICLYQVGCGLGNKIRSKINPNVAEASALDQKVQTVIDEALSYKGTPYQWGGTTSKGMDCSGLMITSFKAADIALPRIAGDQAKAGKNTSLKEIQVGDMVFFTDRKGNKAITHVGLVTQIKKSPQSITFVHASSKGVVESELLSDYWQSVYLQASRPYDFIR